MISSKHACRGPMLIHRSLCNGRSIVSRMGILPLRFCQHTQAFCASCCECSYYNKRIFIKQQSRSMFMQGTCANVIIADLTPSPSDPLLHPHMLSYTTYLGAFQNSSARAGPNALAFQGCSGICCLLVCAVLHAFFSCCICSQLPDALFKQMLWVVSIVSYSLLSSVQQLWQGSRPFCS